MTNTIFFLSGIAVAIIGGFYIQHLCEKKWKK
jgi:hypothetical protein